MRGLVHTAEYYQSVSENDQKRFLEVYEPNIVMNNNKKAQLRFDGVDITVMKENGMIYYFVDFIQLLKKPNVNSMDSESIQERLSSYSRDVFVLSRPLVLKRIDLRLDVQVEDKNQRKDFLKLYSKSLNSFRSLEAQIYGGENVQSIYLMSKAKSKSSSITVNIYDKEQERENKGIEPKDYEEGVIRFEVQIRNKHLNYKFAKNNIPKDAEQYIKDDIHAEYFRKYILPITHTGDYYEKKNAFKILDSSGLKKTERRKIKEFLDFILINDLSKAKETYSRYLYGTYINKLMELRINPVLIPEEYGISFIKNPISDYFK